MSQHSDATYLDHIVKCIEEIGVFMRQPASNQEMEHMRYFAVLRVLQIMAESTTKLSETAKLAMPDIEWHRIRGFRNVLVHDYLGDIDPEVIASVIAQELPMLQAAIQHYRRENHDRTI